MFSSNPPTGKVLISRGDVERALVLVSPGVAITVAHTGLGVGGLCTGNLLSLVLDSGSPGSGFLLKAGRDNLFRALSLAFASLLKAFGSRWCPLLVELSSSSVPFSSCGCSPGMPVYF